jgi:hypothetical protein
MHFVCQGYPSTTTVWHYSPFTNPIWIINREISLARSILAAVAGYELPFFPSGRVVCSAHNFTTQRLKQFHLSCSCLSSGKYMTVLKGIEIKLACHCVSAICQQA